MDLLINKLQRRARWLNIFLLVTSSTTAASWTIWQQEYLKVIWTGVIGLAQMLIIVRPYFSYEKVIKNLVQGYYQLQPVNSEYEKLWLEFYCDRITEDDAILKLNQLKIETQKAQKFSDDIVISDDKSLIEEAESKVFSYAKTISMI